MTLNLDLVRSRFPALASEWAFFDNAGGSQIARPVLDRINEYLVSSNVQHGASYEVSRLAVERVAEAQAAMATFVNALDPSEIVMGGSTSLLFRTLATAFGDTLGPGDEVIVSSGDHEANISPWVDLERVGVTVKFWNPDPNSGELRLEDLAPLLGPRARLVAATHTSNILGTINPIRELADAVHDAGALLCVDGVAHAPHRATDVQALDADFYAFSCYKTYGPHHAVLYGKRDLLLALPSRSFFFISEDDVPYKFQPGGPNYELSYGMLGLLDYLDEVAGAPDGDRHGRGAVEEAFGLIADHEESLSERLLGFLRDRPGVRIIGRPEADRSVRVPVVSFVAEGMKSSDIVSRVDPHRIAIRFGHFYSARLIEQLGLSEQDGVVRVSMVHYNTLDEVDRLLPVLDRILPS